MGNPLHVILENLIKSVEHGTAPKKYARAARVALEELKNPASAMIPLEPESIMDLEEAEVPETQATESAE